MAQGIIRRREKGKSEDRRKSRAIAVIGDHWKVRPAVEYKSKTAAAGAIEI
jgi:hypothetical protein